MYKRTALAKLPQIIEMIDILLENRISCIVAVYHPLIMEAIQAALENRKVPHVDLTNFFQAEDQHNNQKIMLEELEEYGALYNEDGSRKDDHLIIGLVSYPELCSRYRIVK